MRHSRGLNFAHAAWVLGGASWADAPELEKAYLTRQYRIWRANEALRKNQFNVYALGTKVMLIAAAQEALHTNSTSARV